MAPVVRRWVPVAAALAAVPVVALIGLSLGMRDDEAGGPRPDRQAFWDRAGDILPFGPCNNVTPIAEPTGL
jgi:hypothetical protein